MAHWWLRKLYRSIEGIPRRLMRWGHARFLNPGRIDQLEAAGPTGARMAGVLRQLRSGDLGPSTAWIDRIEAERQRLFRSDALVVDEPDAEPGPFDAGKTIRDISTASREPRPATLLHLLIREFQPAVALELGTNLGISSAYLASALRLNGQGTLFTLEGSPHRVRHAQAVHQRLELDNITYVTGLFADTLGGVLDDARPIGFAFVDGHHQKEPTLNYFDAIWPHTREKAVIVFDDIRWSEGMKEAWRTLQEDQRIRVAVDLRDMGLCITTRDPSPEGRYVSSAIAV